MAEHDDIAASLPQPPPPSPGRREAAIALAMRRFEGAEAPAASMPRQARTSWWPKLTMPRVGALVSLVIVAAIGVPLAWNSFNQRPESRAPGVSPGRPSPQVKGGAPAES